MVKRKTIISVMVVCLLTLTCVFCTSCSAKDKIAGTYYLSCIYDDGKVYKSGDSYNNYIISKDFISVKVDKGNTLTLTYYFSDKKIEEKSVWYKYDEYTYCVGIAGSIFYAYFDNGTIAFKDGKTIYILQK